MVELTAVPSQSITPGIAFLAGLVSFVSPCVLPLVPSYLSFLTGSSVEELQGTVTPALRAHVIAHSIAFIAGFTLVFVALGASASALGTMLRANQHLIARIGGIIVIVFGLQMMGVFRLKFLAMDKRVHVQTTTHSYWLSGLIGIAFAAGWSPCIGPILAAILVVASQAGTIAAGVWLLFVYSMGLALPLLLTAAAFGAVLPAFNRAKRLLPAIEAGAGALMIATGLVLVTDNFLRVAGWFYAIVPQPKL